MTTATTAILSILPGVATRDTEEFVTELRYVPEGWLAVGCAALVAAVCWLIVWMYRREGRVGASMRLRMVLASIRCLVVLSLLLILLEPVRVRILRRWIDSYTIVLVDDSSSMDLSDLNRDPRQARRVRAVLETESDAPVRRADLAETVLNSADRRFMRGLARNNRVRLYAFSDEPSLRATIRSERERVLTTDDSADGGTEEEGRSGRAADGDKLLAVEDAPVTFSATGPSTNIERAVRRTVESLGSAPIAAVVVLSDGGFNQGSSAEDTARFTQERKVPILVVGIGDPSPPRNVRVTEMLAPPNAFQQDPFSISARLVAEGVAGETVRVLLRERDTTDSGTGAIVDTRNVTVGAGGTVSTEVAFERKRDRIGRYVYTVEVPPLEGESVTDDNSRQTTVNVIDSRTRVLLIAGGPSWDYRFVSRLLERDETFDVSCWLQSADLSAVRDGNTIIDHMPRRAEELFEYDVVILMDPDESEFDEAWCRLADTFVTEYGGGLLLTAARANTPSFLRERAFEPLIDLLPVTLDPEVDIALNQIGHYQLSAAPIEIPETALGHPIVRMADDPASTKLIWRRIGGVYWHYPVLREKPAATVLMRHGDPRMRNDTGGHVLASVQYVGAGRAAFLGFDGTWRMRRHGIEYFDRFWVQLVRYLSEGKLLAGQKRGMLLTEGDEFSLGDAVTVTARLFDRQYKPLQREQVVAHYSADGAGGSFTLEAQRDRAGWYEGRFVPERTGSYRISISMARLTAGDPLEIVKEIRVTRPNLEILRPQMDRDKLKTLAEQSHGGKYFEIDEAQQVPELIPDLHEEIPIRSRPTSLWDNGAVLAVLLTLLSVEWALRKWGRLL